MARQPSSERSVKDTDDASEATQSSTAPASENSVGHGSGDGGPPSSRADDAASASERAASDFDRAESATDQAAADSDQAASDSDQAAADSDQAASDRTLRAGGDLGLHDTLRELREHNAQQRRDNARARADTASARDAVAEARDLAALARDAAAALRDRELAARDACSEQQSRAMTGAEVLMRAADNRSAATAEREAAAETRAQAAAARELAARDREQAARDRMKAREDRDALLVQLSIAETDHLTGARTRAAGVADLEREIDRARRSTAELVVAYIDVVGLKSLNDTLGHAAGDALLQRAVTVIRSHLRSYDMVIRLGGDEFVCVMSGATIEDAGERFATLRAELAADPQPCELKVGFAALRTEDTAMELINRADVKLPRK